MHAAHADERSKSGDSSRRQDKTRIAPVGAGQSIHAARLFELTKSFVLSCLALPYGMAACRPILAWQSPQTATAYAHELFHIQKRHPLGPMRTTRSFLFMRTLILA